MERPDITSIFSGGVVKIETLDGITLYVHADVFDPERRFCPDVPWGGFKAPTVKRFLEYCYQGDYSFPKPLKAPLATPTSSVDDRSEYADIVCHPGAGYLHDFRCLNGRSYGGFSDTEDEKKWGDSDEGSDTHDYDKDESGPSGHPSGLEYGAVFLAHAELYILSQTQGRSSLASLCLKRLRKALDKAAGAPVRPRFASNLSNLLRYVYEHDNLSLIEDRKAHDLQHLVSSYATMHIQEMKEECSSLMRCGGKLAEDLMMGVVDRLISLEGVSEDLCPPVVHKMLRPGSNWEERIHLDRV